MLSPFERTRPPRLSGLLGACGFVLAALSGPRAIAAPEANVSVNASATCADTSESAQRARLQHRLLQARDGFRACSQSPCASFIRADCEATLRVVEQQLPTVVIAVRSDSGEELTAARVTVDGAPTNYLRGVQIELDPGLHTVRAATVSGSAAALDIVAREGEKNRVVTLLIPRPPVAEVKAAPHATSLPPSHPSPPPAPRSPNRTAEKILGGVGLGLVLASAGFDIAAYSRYHSLSDSCGDAGNCARGDVSTTRALAHTGDALLGVGLATAAAGLIVYLVRGSSEPSPRTSAFAPLTLALPLSQ